MKRFAFVVGVKPITYRGQGLPSLPGAVSDAEIIVKLLRSEADTPSPWVVWPHVIQDVNDRYSSKSALSKDFRKWLQMVREEADGGTHVLVYFAGHGIKPDWADTVDSAEVLLMACDGAWISGSELLEALLDLPVRNKTILLDCCYSGAVSRQLVLRAARGGKVAGMSSFAACEWDADALSLAQKGGEFTGTIEDALTSPGAGVGTSISPSTLAQRILDTWPRLPDEITQRQTPDIVTFDVADRAPIIGPPPVHLGRRPRADDPTHVTVISAEGDFQVEQTADLLLLAWVSPKSGVLHRWSQPIRIEPKERLLAVAATLDARAARVVVTGPLGLRLLRITTGGALSANVISGVDEAAQARFGSGIDQGSLIVTALSGVETRYQLSKLAQDPARSKRV